MARNANWHRNYVEIFHLCAARRLEGKKLVAEMKIFFVGRSFHRVAADVIGPATLTKETAFKLVLVMTDLLTKYVITVPSRINWPPLCPRASSGTEIPSLECPTSCILTKAPTFSADLWWMSAGSWAWIRRGCQHFIHKATDRLSDISEWLSICLHSSVVTTPNFGIEYHPI